MNLLTEELRPGDIIPGVGTVETVDGLRVTLVGRERPLGGTTQEFFQDRPWLDVIRPEVSA